MANLLSWVLPKNMLENSPSQLDGVDAKVEANLRMYGCEIIQEACILLNMPQVGACTGQAIFHRFYARKSMTRYEVKTTAGACVFLAGKYEECGRRLKDVINVVNDILQRREGRERKALILYQADWTRFKDEIVKAERHILRELGFIFTVSHPHQYLPNLLHILDNKNEYPQLRQLSWSLCNDSYRTDLCLRLTPNKVACGAVYLGARHLQFSLPESPGWWLLFDCTIEDIEIFTTAMLDLYSQPKAFHENVYKKKNSLGQTESAAAATSPTTATPGAALTTTTTTTTTSPKIPSPIVPSPPNNNVNIKVEQSTTKSISKSPQPPTVPPPSTLTKTLSQKQQESSNGVNNNSTNDLVTDQNTVKLNESSDGGGTSTTNKTSNGSERKRHRSQSRSRSRSRSPSRSSSSRRHKRSRSSSRSPRYKRSGDSYSSSQRDRERERDRDRDHHYKRGYSSRSYHDEQYKSSKDRDQKSRTDDQKGVSAEDTDRRKKASNGRQTHSNGSCVATVMY